jgi:hypothetical protein
MPKRLPPSFGRAHLGDQVQQEQQRAVADTAAGRGRSGRRSPFLVLLADLLLDLLPLHAEGRVGQHVVELLARGRRR